MPEEPEERAPEHEPESDVREDIADLQIAVVSLADAIDALIDDDDAEASAEVEDALDAVFADG